MQKLRFAGSLGAAGLALVAQSASAGGLYIGEEAAASNVGYGGALFTARKNDASVVFSNPAGMIGMDNELHAGGTLLVLTADFDKDDDNTVSGRGGNASEILPLVNGQYVRQLNDNWAFGVHAGNYFGLLLNWGTQWVGRYTGTQAIVIAPQIQPTLAYKINDQWSVGAGLGLTFGYLKDKKNIREIGPDDGRFRYSDTDFAVQPNLGVMFEPTDDTRISVRYLVETDLNFKDNPSIRSADGSTSPLDTGRKLGLGMTMPQQLMAGVWQRVSERWAVLGNVGWEDWSEFGQIEIDLSGGVVDDTVEIATEDTWHVGIGAEYQKTAKLMYTMGASWDSSWQRDNNRTALVPIGTVYRVGGGFKYEKTEDFEWGAGFSVFYEGDLPIAPVDYTGPGPDQRFSGQYSNVVLYWASIFGSWR